MDVSGIYGKTALVTGASSGLGKEFAKQLHAAGAQVILVARREDRLHEIADQFNHQRKDSAQVFVCDLAGSDLSKLEEFIKGCDIELLVCNAGRGSFGRFEQLLIKEEEELVRLNVIAPLRLMHAVIPQMKERRSGAIISVASIAAFQSLPYMSTYSATKAFNLNHALGIRHELKEFGIRVIALCPGPTATEYHVVAGIPGQWSAAYHDTAIDVVHGALRALRNDQAWMTPGIRSRILAFFSRLLPLEFSCAISRRILAGALRFKAE